MTHSRLSPLQVCKFLCGVAWADASIDPEERAYILNLAELMGLTEPERKSVEGWLALPPDPHDIAPSRLSDEDKHNLILQALILVNIDGQVTSHEGRLIKLLSKMLRLGDDELGELRAKITELYADLAVKP